MTGMVLADAGARVVKVEPPEGDRLRALSPSAFLVWNRGKESLVADLRTEAGREDLRSLAGAADVVLEGFSPGTADGWGVGSDALQAVKPGLVYCAFSAFGSSGAYSRVKGYDSLVAAKVGFWARGAFGHRDGPILAPVAWASFGAAMQAVAGVVGALLVRDRTGRGQRVDATLYAGLDPIEYFVGTIVQLMTKKGEKPSADARSATAASRFGVLVATKDGRLIQTATLLPHQGKALCEVAGIGHVLEERRFSRLPQFDTPDDAQAWEDLVVETFREEDLAHWLPRLLESPDVAFEVGGTCEEGLEHPQVVHNGDVITIEDPEVGPVSQVGPIGHYSRTPMEPTRSAPALGDANGPLVAQPVDRDAAESPAHPFAGVTIVEFGSFYAMPYSVTMAAALGARVIKLEDRHGDPHRASFGPEVASTKTMAGKESLSVDLRSPAGQAIVHKLIERADVFITGFRSGVPERVGLGYDELRALNPQLVYVHAAGYGSDGPYAHRALYAQSAQAVAGSFGRQVGFWADPAQNLGMSVPELQAIIFPRLNQIIDGDSNAALGVLAAMSLAVYHQQRTGEGQKVTTSMLAGNAWAYSDDFCAYDGKPPAPLGDSEYFGTSALDRAYPAAEGTWVCIVVPTDREFEALARTIGLPELATDERFATGAARAANDAELAAALASRFAEKPGAEWEAMLTDADVGCVNANLDGHPVTNSFDPALREAGLTVTYDHPAFGEMVRAAPPVTFSDTPGRVAPPCARGQHNRAILTELGYSDDDITGFEKDEVVFPPAP
jgi:crotonobetainyl-CoA:carnitine CoA-transferase CaiB-like acyl-CoA transferase